MSCTRSRPLLLKEHWSRSWGQMLLSWKHLGIYQNLKQYMTDVLSNTVFVYCVVCVCVLSVFSVSHQVLVNKQFTPAQENMAFIFSRQWLHWFSSNIASLGSLFLLGNIVFEVLNWFKCSWNTPFLLYHFQLKAKRFFPIICIREALQRGTMVKRAHSGPRPLVWSLSCYLTAVWP